MTNLQYTSDLKNRLQLRRRPSVLNKKDAAIRYANNCIKSHFVMIGDDSKYWVVCGSDANRLSKIGYKFAK